jgi:hypothetical protein
VELQAVKIDGPRPALVGAEAERVVPEGDDPFDAWAAMLERLLQIWV